MQVADFAAAELAAMHVVVRVSAAPAITVQRSAVAVPAVFVAKVPAVV